MSRLEIPIPNRAQLVVEELYRDLERRIESSPSGLCPIDMSKAFLELCHAQSCGKCVPCRVGLSQLKAMITDVLEGRATLTILDEIKETAECIMESADCAIGYEAANMVYKGLQGFREEYEAHIEQGRCTCTYQQPVPCVSLCPAGVDIPGYIALVYEGRYEDAVRLIRKDNPFPVTCGFICEHPCEARCRRNMGASICSPGCLREATVQQVPQRSSARSGRQRCWQPILMNIWAITTVYQVRWRCLSPTLRTEIPAVV